jgi:hypothetical protein
MGSGAIENHIESLNTRQNNKLLNNNNKNKQ